MSPIRINSTFIYFISVCDSVSAKKKIVNAFFSIVVEFFLLQTVHTQMLSCFHFLLFLTNFAVCFYFHRHRRKAKYTRTYCVLPIIRLCHCKRLEKLRKVKKNYLVKAKVDYAKHKNVFFYLQISWDIKIHFKKIARSEI